jgi:flagellar basal-body rod protein FlgF
MNVSLYQAAAAMSAYSQWQEAIGANIAATSVPGFRKSDVSFSAVQAGLMSTTGPVLPSVLPRAEKVVDLRPGEIEQTGSPTDVAIEGSGYFEVQMMNGSMAYTRAGDFRMNGQGQLVTREGFLIMGEGGSIQLDPSNSGQINVSPTGEISQGMDLKGKIKLVNFSDPSQLNPIIDRYFVASNPNVRPTPALYSTMRQRCLESANVSTVQEMVNLINASRSFDANQRVILLNDERMSRAINVLGNNV